jgi:hypothetical protein
MIKHDSDVLMVSGFEEVDCARKVKVERKSRGKQLSDRDH